MTVAALGLGMAFGLGLVLIGLGWRAAPPTPSTGRRPWDAINDLSVPHPSRAVTAAGVALVVLVVTRWPVLAVSAAAAAWWYLNSRGKDQGTTIERTEAIAAWAEMLGDATGTARGIEGVLVSTADTAPLPIRSPVVRFTRRLTYETLEDALPDLADELDDPNGDLIVAALRLAAASGGRDLRSVLDDVALAARDEARMRRRVEVSRERPRSDMRQVIVAIVVVIVLLILGPSRDYLTPYSSLGGQLVMSVAAAFWIGGLGAMARLARVPPLQRILTRTEHTR